MNIRVTRRKIELDEDLPGYIEKKASKLERFFAKVQSVDVIFKGEKTQCTCEIEVVAKPLHVVASSDGPDPKSAFDQTLKVVERAIKKQKTRLIDSKRTAGMPERPVTEAEEGGEEEELA